MGVVIRVRSGVALIFPACSIKHGVVRRRFPECDKRHDHASWRLFACIPKNVPKCFDVVFHGHNPLISLIALMVDMIAQTQWQARRN